MFVDNDGFLSIRLSSGDWIGAGKARQRIADALKTDLATAAVLLKTRLVSGHVVASAANVYGPVSKRERIKFTDGRDMIPNGNWQWIEPGDALWLIGDLQLRVVGSDVSSLRSVTYTDVRFLKLNIDTLVAAAAPDLSGCAVTRMPPTKSSKRISPTSPEWVAWMAAYKNDHSTLPDVDRVIFPAAKQAFGDRVTQKMVRASFGGEKPGPRN